VASPVYQRAGKALGAEYDIDANFYKLVVKRKNKTSAQALDMNG
jgi:hypothetical protein